MRCLPLVALFLFGCSERSDEAIGARVAALAQLEGGEAIRAAERLGADGRRALPAIEGALHGANEPGRKNLILALRRIGHADAVPLLRQLALYDKSASVRREAQWTLQQWALGSDDRALKARAALRLIDELRGREEPS